MKLDADVSINPTRQPQRPVVFHLKEAVEKELLERINAGILDQTRGMTPWASNMVVIPKDKQVDEQGRPSTDKSVRITVDSKAVNKATSGFEICNDDNNECGPTEVFEAASAARLKYSPRRSVSYLRI